MVGEEYMDEALDDLCLLLGYGIRSSHSHLLYATYTAWWEVEGYADPDGEFVCLDVAALQQHLITMPIKQFDLVTELAYQVCMLDAKAEGQACPPRGQEWLRALAIWLSNGARQPFHRQIWRKESLTAPPVPQQQLTRKQRRAQQRKLENELVERAWQCGYLLLGPEVSNQVPVLVQSSSGFHGSVAGNPDTIRGSTRSQPGRLSGATTRVGGSEEARVDQSYHTFERARTGSNLSRSRRNGRLA